MYVDNNFYASHVPVWTVHTYSDALPKLHAEFHHGLQEFRKVERTIDPWPSPFTLLSKRHRIIDIRSQ